ncbi:HTH-type transcriptional regulator DmlR [Pseudovibrio axinellae]|uniref:HTH-type transcriptional regulator DmlR n=1 Tax=Pseudovibrio axinellae TaxID=989403 RepID=A0A166AJJ9_9HYPH|nr:LysR family transcriptional regulator [Pseudovibrio axinellae]KZL21197.1 HTH-type transcriptional regulator DmlR [Pseudovibrio axinellae]SEQ91614.1 transcriptional regulator, LysR family [Pseudovibrio axinellae]
MKTKIQLARTLIAAVEGGSVAAGARALNISRSAASKNITVLESLLGVQLLKRTSRNLSLTEVGEAYLKGVAPALAAIELTEGHVSQFKSEPSGVLTIDSSALFGRSFLSSIIQDYLRAYPRMTIDLRLNDGPSEVASGVVDLYFRTGHVKHQDMVAIKLMDIGFPTTASPDYIERCGRPQFVDSLANHNCLNFRFSSDHALYQWSFKIENEVLLCNFAGNFISTDAAELRKAALAGLGVTQLPYQLVEDDIQRGALINLFPETMFPSKELSMCYQRSRKNDVKLLSFKKFLSQYLA